ncbi:signal transduction protein [Rhodoferax antarcticus]|nr:signal transduction protein [Rhodoferax antarcticus]
MSQLFPFQTAPFHALSSTEQARLQDAAKLVEHSAGEPLGAGAGAASQLWLVHTGHVQREEEGHVHVLEAGETTGWRAVLTGRNHASCTALDAVNAWELPRDLLLVFLADNTRFAGLVFADISGDLASDTQADHDREMMSLMLVRVKDAYLQKPLFVDADMDVVSVCRFLADHKATHTLVRDTQAVPQRIGMFTTTDLRDALLNSIAPSALPVRAVARFDLISLPADAELFDALLIMLRHRVHRVLVQDGEQILGVLSQLDLMSFMSNHSHLITLQVEQAHTVEDLRRAALAVDDSVKALQRGGMRVEVISRLVSELNGQIFAKLWSLLAPPELVQRSCLLVMGSEGRSEQILKTDQDNALLIQDGYHHPSLVQITEQFSAALLTFGYPPCPGNIMVTNPIWRQHLAEFRSSVGQWLYGGDPEGKMNLAIFLDARALAGDASLLEQARSYTVQLVRGSDSFLARMASAVDQFTEPATGFWGRLSSLQVKDADTFDLKKIGTFPIVHGARVMALEHKLDALGTADRLKALAQLQFLPAPLARDLVETLHMLMGLKLRNNLRQRSLGEPLSNLVQLSSLGTLDRDQLKDALAIIRQFKLHIKLRYRLP